MPTSTTPVGRLLLERAITVAARRAAAPGNLRFTERQLYYETCRVLRPTPAPVRRIPHSPAPPLRLSRFTEALRGREPAGLLPAPVTAAPTIGGPAREPDLYAYGLPRLLICQDRAIAGMLLANHAHLEAACPVLSAEDDLPLDPRLVAALERAEGATVHVLHDASPTGIALPARVRDALGPASARVASLGLVPRHAEALRLVSGRRPAPVPPLAPLPRGLRPAEAAWLAGGRFAEVAAVPPARLLRAVLRLTRGPRPARQSVWGDLRELRTAGFMTWPDG
ncbi:hypothetical protein JCM4814A_07760 [Streptomyces phaeofaciens JCM 4814]|uniref:Uncharacterized protein n=1 Tax=Streptomyces phaeofaciens TaxID=68254 RepID=A0A918HIF0_9ACTN|nr:hypothetical protein [Streptomyces phaeofaciens]GGT65971.1 hypothetical protein GCM10010226_49660 [Streptomyces phaeofaciens]